MWNKWHEEEIKSEENEHKVNDEDDDDDDFVRTTQFDVEDKRRRHMFRMCKCVILKN